MNICEISPETLNLLLIIVVGTGKFLAQASWPLMLIVAAWMFRTELARLLNRVVRFGKDGFDAPYLQPQQPQADATPPSTFVLPPNVPRASHVIADIESKVRRDLQDYGEHERLGAIVRAFSVLQARYSFERIYRVIFGSQIRLLKAAQLAPITIDTARAIYDDIATANPDLYANHTFENWLGYLTSSSLLLQQGQTLIATIAGGEFLTYMITERMPEYKLW